MSVIFGQYQPQRGNTTTERKKPAPTKSTPASSAGSRRSGTWSPYYEAAYVGDSDCSSDSSSSSDSCD